MSRWERISVELSHTWPGEAYLRFQAADGTATMVAVDNDDLQRIGLLRNSLGRPSAEDDDEAVPAARKAGSGPGWPRESPPEPGIIHTDGAGREWAKDTDDRWWIEAGGRWYPSFPETISQPQP